MRKKQVLAVLIAGCLLLQGAGSTFSAMAAEAEPTEAETVLSGTDIEEGEDISEDGSESETENPECDVDAEETDSSSIEAEPSLSETENETGAVSDDLPEPTEPEETVKTENIVETVEPTDTVETINGIPVDYDDPDCLKYLALHGGEASVPVTFATQDLTSDYATIWGGTTYYHADDAAKGKNILPGIDVSKWQGDINWTKVEAAGVEFAFIRLGNTNAASPFTCNLDPVYSDNMDMAIQAGIKVGVYYYSQAITVSEAKKEAQYVLDHLGGYSLDLPIVMDYEYYGSGGRLTSSTPDKATKTEIVQAFCQVIEDAGYTACVYGSKSFFEDDLNTDTFDETYQIWMANWPGTNSDGTKKPSSYGGTYQYWQCSDVESVSGISGYVDLDWWYQDTASMENIDGKLTYTVNGEPDYTVTGLVHTGSGRYYVRKGVVDDSYTGLARDRDGSSWWYVENGKVTNHYNGFAENSNGKWYCENSKVTFKTNDVIKDETGAIGPKGTWYYVVKSKVKTSYTGVADYKNKNGWWYIKKGAVDFSYTGLAKNKNGWWYVKDGKVRFNYTGFAENANGKWYCENSKVTFKRNSVIKDKTGAIGPKGTWYYVVGSKAQTSYTGVANYKNENGWWYIKNGKVDFTANTVAKNKNGWWYVKGGKVRFDYTGTVWSNGKAYSVKNGKVKR